jgi:hypothetical protein
VHFLRLVAALFFCFCLLIGTISLAASNQPNPIAPLFTNPDGSACEMPCLLGVQPGKMTIDQALAILNAHPLMVGLKHQPLSNYGVQFYTAQFNLSLVTDENDSHNITGISINWNNRWDNVASTTDLAADSNPALRSVISGTSIGNVMSYFGRVDVIDASAFENYDTGEEHANFVECFRSASLCASSDAITPEASASLTVYAPEMYYEGVLSDPQCNVWGGFKALDRYLDQLDCQKTLNAPNS